MGFGILTENNKIKDASPTDEIEEGGVMVLGNDFGTLEYIEKVIIDSEGVGETNGTTVRNMKNHIPELFTNKTFFTNFYLGVRTNKDAKMMVKIEELSDGYKSLKELYSGEKNKYIIENMALYGIKFIIIPHPCFLPELLKHPYLAKLKDFLNPK